MDRGAAPRHELRYHFKKGTVETVVMEMQMAVKMKMGGQPVPAGEQPAMKMTMKVETLEVMDNGDAKLAMEMTAGDIVPDPVANPQVAAAMQQMCSKWWD